MNQQISELLLEAKNKIDEALNLLNNNLSLSNRIVPLCFIIFFTKNIYL